MSLAALIQVVTVHRPRTMTALRNRRASREAERRSMAAASRENHWHGAGFGCEDVIGGRLRSVCQAGVVTAIVPTGPAPVYSPFGTPGRASMLAAAEIMELERCLKLYQWRILDNDEVVRRLGAVARPHNLDAILAGLPPELIEPLRAQTRAYRPVRAIGYWCPSGLPPSRPSLHRPSDAAFPDPRRLVCSGPYPVDREALVGYLRSGREFARWRGLSYCRFGCGGGNASMGSRCLTDGEWVWPEGLSHYVEAHSILLPEDFARVAGAIGSSPPRDGQMPSYDTQGEPDYDFWVAWGQSAMTPAR